LPLSVGEILKEVDELEAEQKQFKSELFKITWYMRGGVTLEEAYAMTFEDRNIVQDIVKENMETTKKTQLPFF